MTSITDALAAAFPPENISWRVGSTTADKKKGMALAFIDARDVMERLDTVCGAANWQDRYEFHGARTLCYLSIRIDGEWITKADGAGDSDVEAEKGAISDALKRAAVKWGIGRYIYDLASPWVEIEQAGRSYRIKESEKRKLANAARVTVSRAEQAEAGPPQSDDTTLSAAADFAIATMRTSRDLSELVEFWTSNARALKATLRPIEFEAVEKAKDAEKARLSQAQSETPFDRKEAA